MPLKLKGFTCPRCGKKVKIMTTLDYFKHDDFAKYIALCRNPICMVDRFYWNLKK